MSEILGHDVNGRPLRAGDRVVLLSARNPRFKADIGRVVTVRDVFDGDHAFCDETLRNGKGPGGYALEMRTVRRLDDRTDHQPSEYTFDSLMDHLKSGAPA